MANLTEKLTDHNIEKTLAELLGTQVQDVNQALTHSNMTASQYAQLLTILDNNDKPTNMNDLHVFIQKFPMLSKFIKKAEDKSHQKNLKQKGAVRSAYPYRWVKKNPMTAIAKANVSGKDFLVTFQKTSNRWIMTYPEDLVITANGGEQIKLLGTMVNIMENFIVSDSPNMLMFSCGDMKTSNLLRRIFKIFSTEMQYDLKVVNSQNQTAFRLLKKVNESITESSQIAMSLTDALKSFSEKALAVPKGTFFVGQIYGKNKFIVISEDDFYRMKEKPELIAEYRGNRLLLEGKNQKSIVVQTPQPPNPVAKALAVTKPKAGAMGSNKYTKQDRKLGKQMLKRELSEDLSPVEMNALKNKLRTAKKGTMAATPIKEEEVDLVGITKVNNKDQLAIKTKKGEVKIVDPSSVKV